MPIRASLAGLRAAATALAVALAFTGIAVGFKLVIHAFLEANAGFAIYVPAIAFAAWFRGLFSGLVVTILSALADMILFLPPVAVLGLEVREDQVRLAAYLLGGSSVSFLSHRLRIARDDARLEAVERRRALEAEAEARRRLDELVGSQQQAAELREAFNSIISHELRTPITAIYGAAKLLSSRGRALDEATREELIGDLEAETERLYRLVEDLLILARTERGTIEIGHEPVLLPHVSERVVRSEQERWPAARFERRVEAAVVAARGDETYIEQILRNLLGNAAKYSPAGALIAVVVDESDEGPRIRVLDQGVGLDPAEANRLFDLYYRSPTTSATTGGAGIGLFVCRHLVEAMGGRIWATARPAGGAEFGFVLPRYDEAAEPPPGLRRGATESADAMDQVEATDRPRAAAPPAAQSPGLRPD